MTNELKLTAKMEAFCNEYIIDLNGTQAAIRAGYSKNSANEIAAENLAKPSIQARLSQLMQERNERNKIDADYVLQRAKMMHEVCWSNDDAKNAIASLKLVGDHIGVQAFKQQTEISGGITVEAKGLDAFYDEVGDDEP